MILFPQFDPVAFSVGPVQVHWYGLAYVTAFLLGLMYAKHIARVHPAPGVTPDALESLFSYIVAGVILGGRLGYVLFYNLPHYLQEPLDVFKVWQGGMSFHGGLVGVVLAMAWFAWKKQVNVMDLADRLAPVFPIGLLLGRAANFVNGELVGRVTSPELPWAFVFPQIDLYPRHPSQLYELALEGVLLFGLLWWLTRGGIRRWEPSGVFLVGYGVARFFVENFRTPEIVHDLGFVTITQGQVLCLPMMVVGLLMMWVAQKREALR